MGHGSGPSHMPLAQRLQHAESAFSLAGVRPEIASKCFSEVRLLPVHFENSGSEAPRRAVRFAECSHGVHRSAN